MAEHTKSDDIDPLETTEWLEALESVLKREGPERAHFLLDKLIEKGRRSGANLRFNANTAYLNTIPLEQEEKNPGDLELESRILALIRWNAMAMVVQANRSASSVGVDILPVLLLQPPSMRSGSTTSFMRPLPNMGDTCCISKDIVLRESMPDPFWKAG